MEPDDSGTINPVTNYPALTASLVAGVAISVLAHYVGAVPDAAQDAIQTLAGWLVPIALTLAAGLFTHRRVRVVPPQERGL